MSAPTFEPVRRLEDLPSPPGLPILGNLHQLDPPRLHQQLEAWCEKLGPPYAVRMGGKRIFVSADPQSLQTALRERPERFRRVRTIEPVFAEIGANGLFSVEGDAWKPQRQLIMRALAPTHFNAFYPTLRSITDRLRRSWQRAADRGEEVEMTRDLVRYTVDVTTALAFGEDPNTIERDGDVIQDHLAYVFPMVATRVTALFPWWRYVRLPRDRRFDRALAAIHRHVRALIESARARMRADPSAAPRNVLETMLALRDEPGSGVTDEMISANVLTLLLGGEDTTAHTLAWTMFCLAGDPRLQDRLHVQARDVLGDSLVAASLEDTRRLDLFEAAATEATRFKPIVPMLFLEPVVDVHLDGVELPAGTPLFFVLRPAMLDDRHFHDALRFDLDRWTRGRQIPEQVHDNRAYVQFGAGPRVCPGRHLAGIEMRLVLSMLTRNFRFELAVDPASIREVSRFTMTPSAMPMRLHARN